MSLIVSAMLPRHNYNNAEQEIQSEQEQDYNGRWLVISQETTDIQSRYLISWTPFAFVCIVAQSYHIRQGLSTHISRFNTDSV